MPHAGSLYGMPELFAENDTDSVDDDDDADPLDFEDDGNVTTADIIAEHAAEAIMNAQLPKFVQDLTRDIAENGLEALRKWYPMS